MGYQIKWISKRTLKINGVRKLNKTTYSVMFDRIEAGTYLIVGAITQGNLKIKNIESNIIRTEINVLKKSSKNYQKKMKYIL